MAFPGQNACSPVGKLVPYVLADDAWIQPGRRQFRRRDLRQKYGSGTHLLRVSFGRGFAEGPVVNDTSYLRGRLSMQNDRIALDRELGIFHRIPPAEEKEHFVIGRSCRCCPSLEIVDEFTVIVDHKTIAAAAAAVHESR
jgi:hypothetical protein